MGGAKGCGCEHGRSQWVGGVKQYCFTPPRPVRNSGWITNSPSVQTMIIVTSGYETKKEESLPQPGSLIDSCMRIEGCDIW